jgi:hypothetical protein
MEHNEYAVHELKIRFVATSRTTCGEHTHLSHSTKEGTFYYVAPAQGYRAAHLGKLLLEIHLDERFRNSEPLVSGLRYEVLEQKEYPLEAMIRYSDQYRDRI